ncbi:hypothetical protein MNBD_GAMMA12-20 [hydrothermal vent metagenome]|uniref:NADPH-dependent FMN reductase-like domain-containing protein n=1 Tax=hydrothermal vent metagenome TaxID=652676 RepID=A0A3B0YT88_9ZZZZ
MSKYVVISGSTRNNSESSKVARQVIKCLKESDQEQEAELVDLSSAKIPNWSETFWEEEAPSAEWTVVSNQLKECLAVVIVAPEWNGMVPPELMNIFLLASKNEFAHKPAMIVGVSSGVGGTYPVAQLRNFGAKNTRLVYMPDHVIVKDVCNVFNEDKAVSEDDKYLRERLLYSTRMLKVYADAFVAIRDSGVYDRASFPYGM